jgi:hypothetical protein
LAGPTIDQVEVEHNPGFGDRGRGQIRGIVDGGLLTIQGWVIGNCSLPVKIELIDETGVHVGEVPIDQRRDDIAEAFPGVPGSSSAGFRGTVRPAGRGAGDLRVLVDFDEGEAVEFAVLRCQILAEDSATSPVEEPGRWSLVTIDREAEKVFVGKEGWLYLRRDTNDILGQQTGRVRLSDEQLLGWRSVLLKRRDESRRLGARWSCLVAPDKESVYPEFLPDPISPVARRPVHEFLDVAASVGAPVGYALEPLLQAKADFDVYSRTDTHWNFRGAYLAYRAFCADLARQGVELEALGEDDLEWVDAEIEGDLGSKVRPEPMRGPTIRVGISHPRGRLCFDNEVKNHGRVMCFEREGDGLTCVLFGESFANYLLPFLKETFSRLVFVHTSMFIPRILELERADVALSLPLERFLVRVPDDANAFAELEATTLRKGGGLPW